MQIEKKKLIWQVAFVWGWMVWGCGSPQQGALAVKVRFASHRQAQNDSGGLPLEIRSYSVEARDGGLDGQLVEGSGCRDIGADDPRRSSTHMDLDAHDNLALVVEGFERFGCTGSTDWMGVALGVEVVEGQQIHVPIYVTRRGMRVNPTRAAFLRPRAFATATALPDGRILVAGGFELPSGSSSSSELEAACDAIIYDPGSATFGNPISLSAGCRGLHRALTLSDNRVLLVGGCRLATVHLDGGALIRARQEELLSTADLFDPVTETFAMIGPASELRRADAAAVVLDDNSVVLMGGRTAVSKSPDVVVGTHSDTSGWDWSILQTQLSAERSGARAASLGVGIFLAGGDLWIEPQPVELLDKSTFVSTPLTLAESVSSLNGHALVKVDGTRLVLAGGVEGHPGARPIDTLLEITFEGQDPSVRENALLHPRAYHTAALLSGEQILMAGGLNETFQASKDLEVLTLGGTSQLLQDTLGTGSAGMAVASLPDGSILLAGGLDPVDGSAAVLSSTVQLLSP